MLAEIVRSPFTGRGDPSEFVQPYLPCCDLQPFSRVKKNSSEERTNTNHDNLPRETQSNNDASNFIAHNLHKLSSCVF